MWWVEPNFECIIYYFDILLWVSELISKVFFFSSHLFWKCVCVFWFELIAILTYGSVIQCNATGIYIMHHMKFAMLFFRIGIHTKFLQKYRITCEMPKQMGSHNKTNAKNTLIRLVILAIFYKYIYIFNADWAYLLNACCTLCNA